MNEYFCSIGKNFASKIEYAPNPLLAGDSVVNKKSTPLKFKHISALDIRDAIAKLKVLPKRSRFFTIQRSTCMLSEMSRAFGHLVELSRELCFLPSEVWSSAKLSSFVERTHVLLEFIK